MNKNEKRQTVLYLIILALIFSLILYKLPAGLQQLDEKYKVPKEVLNHTKEPDTEYHFQ